MQFVLEEGYYADGLSWFALDPMAEIFENTIYYFFHKMEEFFKAYASIAICDTSKTIGDWCTAIGDYAIAEFGGIAVGEDAIAAQGSTAIKGKCFGYSSVAIHADTDKDNVVVIGPMEIDCNRETLHIKNIESENIKVLTEKVNKMSSSSLTVTTYTFPSQRNIEVQENAFTFIWQNITVPARSEVYALVTVNLNASPAEGQRIALGFVAEGLNVAATAAPLPVVSGVEHSMCLTHWFEEETTLSVAVHSTITAYVTNIVSPLDAKMNGGSELIVKTYA